jgi:hypothetical protein
MNEIRDTTAWIGHALAGMAYAVFLSFGPLAAPMASEGSVATGRCQDESRRETGDGR